VVISTIAHGALLALVAQWLQSPVKRQGGDVPPQRANTVASPIEVAFIVEESPPVGSSAGSSTRRMTRAAAAGAAAALAPGIDRTTAPTPPSGLLRMRGTDLRLDAAAAERIAGAAETPHAEPTKSGKLQDQPDGSAVLDDTVTSMTVDADGKARFVDKPDFDATIQRGPAALLDPKVREEVRVHVAKWLEDPWEATRYGPTQELPRHLQAVPGACDAWLSDLCQDPLAPDFEKRLRALKHKLGVGISGKLDITAYLHRKLVGDPYAARKLKLLDDTRDERVAMGERHAAQQAVRSAELMTRNLEALWQRVPEPIARRAALFELWDECGEDAAGTRTRAVVIDWIRARLPSDSADAYTTEELTVLDARRTSATPFAPYTP
jgi:hypothetical protein